MNVSYGDSGKNFHNKIYSGLTILAGSLASINLLYFSSSKINYTHSFFIILVLNFGMALCLPVYYLLRRCKIIKMEKEEYNLISGEKLPKAKLVNFISASFFDGLSSYLLIFCIGFLPSDVYIILRIFQVLTIFISVQIFNKDIPDNRLNKFHIIGLLLASLGQIIYGTIFLVEEPFVFVVFGLGLSLIISCIISLKFSYEQNIFFNYKIHPMKATGYEGVLSLIVSTIIFIIALFIPCNNNILSKICQQDGYLASMNAFSDMKGNILIPFMLIIYILLIASKNYFDMCLGLVSTPYNRVIIDSIRAIPVCFTMIEINNTLSLICLILGSLFILIGVVVFLNI